MLIGGKNQVSVMGASLLGAETRPRHLRDASNYLHSHETEIDGEKDDH